MELTDASPEECHKRNIHNRSLADIQQAAAQWQGTPPVYPLLDLGPLFGFNRKKSKQVHFEWHVRWPCLHSRNLAPACSPAACDATLCMCMFQHQCRIV